MFQSILRLLASCCLSCFGRGSHAKSLRDSRPKALPGTIQFQSHGRFLCTAWGPPNNKSGMFLVDLEGFVTLWGWTAHGAMLLLLLELDSANIHKHWMAASCVDALCIEPWRWTASTCALCFFSSAEPGHRTRCMCWLQELHLCRKFAPSLLLL